MTDDEVLDGLDELLQVLDERERIVVFRRFGLDGGKKKTLEAVGKELGVTRERVRQMQNIALSKLRRALTKKDEALDKDLVWKPNLPIPPQEPFVPWTPERRKKASEAQKKAWKERKAQQVEAAREISWEEYVALPLPRPVLWYDCKIPLNALRLTFNRYQQQ